MIYLIILDLFWSLSAFIWDWPKMAQINPFAWPFVLICPIYPLLLALIWFQLYRKSRPNQLLLAFAVIPSVIFGILAVLYYPTAMVYQGFSWNAFGQIFWVLFYALQAAYLFSKYKIARYAFVIASIYLIIKFVLDYKYLTFGYLDFENFPNALVLTLILVAIASVGVLWSLDSKKKKQ